LTPERARGCLLGLAIGDAMGAPFEGGGRPYRWVRRMTPEGPIRRRAGEVTDDTLQAMAVARSLVVCRGYSGPDLARRLLEGFRTHPEFYGPTSSRVFSLIEAGIEPQEAAMLAGAERGGSRTNGPVMRGAPIGVVYRGLEVEEISAAAAHLTHDDPVTGAASGFVNRMVSELCRGRVREGAFMAAVGGCRDQETLAAMAAWWRRPPVPSLDAIDLAHAAVTVFMTTGSFEESILSAVNMGGDSDTLGAVVGALAGATYGDAAIPREWLVRVAERKELIVLADGLVNVAR